MNEIKLVKKSYEELQEMVIQLTTDKFLLNTKLEAYENMIKELIEFIKKHQRKDEFLNLNEWETRDLLNILNKVGEDNE